MTEHGMRTDARGIAAVAMAVIDTAAPVIVQRDVSPEGAAVAIAWWSWAGAPA